MSETAGTLNPGLAGSESGSIRGSGGARNKCRAHCSCCHACFAGDAAFDAHRTGPVDARRCADPAKVKRLQAKTGHGTCALGWPGEVRDVTLWQNVPSGFAA